MAISLPTHKSVDALYNTTVMLATRSLDSTAGVVGVMARGLETSQLVNVKVTMDEAIFCFDCFILHFQTFASF